MALTKDFRETIFARAHRDPKFRRELLTSALRELLSGDIELGKSILRDYINATVSFKTLASKLHKNSKSLQRMLSSSGNPTLESLCEMLSALQKMEGVRLEVNVVSSKDKGSLH